MTTFVVFLMSTLSLGGTLTLIALGLVLIMRATGVFNFAQGQFMILPALITAQLSMHGWPFWVSLALGLIFGAGIAALFYRFVLERTVGINHIYPVIATLAFASVLDGVMGIVFGTQSYSLTIPGVPDTTVTLAGAQFTVISIVMAVGSLLLAVIVAAVLRYTRVGTRVLSAGQDPLLASLSAVNVRRVFLISWAIAAVLAGLAGVAYASTTVINPTVVSMALLAAPAMVIGGLDSIEGALVGGIAIGAVQAATATFLGGEYIDVVSYVILLVALQLFPNGIFGTKQIVRA